MSRLASAVIVQAVLDVQGGDVLRALDALLWLLDDCPLWLDGLGLHSDPVMLLTGGKIKAVSSERRS